MQGALRVGILVVVFGLLLVGIYSVLGRKFLTEKTNNYYADFTDAAGAGQGTPVLMAGVKIGEVQKVDLATPKLARLTLSIEQQYGIPVGSMAEIQSSLIGFGQQPIVIVPPDNITGINLPPKAILKGIHSSPIEQYLPEAKQTISELNRTLAATRNLLQDEKLRGGVEKLLESSSKTVAQFGLVAQHADALLASNQSTIQTAINNAAHAMSDIQKSTAIVAQFAKDPRWKNESIGLLDKLNATSKRAETLMENLNAFVVDPRVRQPINQSLANTEKITDTGTRIAANTEVMSKNGIVMTQKAIEIEDKAKVLEDDAKGVLDKLQNVFGFKKPSAPLLAGVSGTIDLIRESHPGHTRTDINVTVPLKGDNLHVGVYDAFESNKINLELGKPFGNSSEFLYGIYASKPGVGVDYRIAPRLFLRSDLYNTNSPRLDLRARIEFGKGFYGWLGLDQLFKYNAPQIGFGFRR